MAKANDTFVEGSDTALTSHTPTGTDAGTGWDFAGAGDAALVRAATDDVRDDNTSQGSRFRMTDDLGDDEMDVQADVSFENAAIGDTLFAGPTGRHPSSAGNGSYEFDYDWSVGVNGSWTLAGDTLDEAWPGGTVTLKLTIRDNDQRGYADGVQKVSSTSNNGTGNTRGGLLLGNFTGNSSKRSVADNFQANNVIARLRRRIEGY